MDDAIRIHELSNDKAITSTTLRIPYPSTLEDTKNFIKACESCNLVHGIVFTILLKDTREIIGVISLEIEPEHERGMFGYWIGKDYWGNGYCTEAARAVLDFGFKKLNLHRIFAQYMKENEASGKIMKNIGMQYEGCLKEHVKKDGIFKDMIQYGIFF
jgi:hypothetical protein